MIFVNNVISILLNKYYSFEPMKLKRLEIHCYLKSNTTKCNFQIYRLINFLSFGMLYHLNGVDHLL